MFETSDEEFYLLIDDTNNEPLTEAEQAHLEWVQSQPGYQSRLAEEERKIKAEFGLE